MEYRVELPSASPIAGMNTMLNNKITKREIKQGAHIFKKISIIKKYLTSKKIHQRLCGILFDLYKNTC
jgi:hypothetical protein